MKNKEIVKNLVESIVLIMIFTGVLYMIKAIIGFEFTVILGIAFMLTRLAVEDIEIK